MKPIDRLKLIENLLKIALKSLNEISQERGSDGHATEAALLADQTLVDMNKEIDKKNDLSKDRVLH